MEEEKKERNAAEIFRKKQSQPISVRAGHRSASFGHIVRAHRPGTLFGLALSHYLSN
jgi:hypothetical protein